MKWKEILGRKHARSAHDPYGSLSVILNPITKDEVLVCVEDSMPDMIHPWSEWEVIRECATKEDVERVEYQDNL